MHARPHRLDDFAREPAEGGPVGGGPVELDGLDVHGDALDGLAAQRALVRRELEGVGDLVAEVVGREGDFGVGVDGDVLVRVCRKAVSTH